VPRIPQRALDCVFYLYPTRAAAERGEGFGGTGFLVGYVSRDPTLTFVYGVTNWHVAVRDGHSVIRINRSATVDILEFDPSEWTFIPNGDDVAVSPAIPLDVRDHTLSSVVFTDTFSTIRKRRHSIGVGDDVVMLGRFVDHDGGERNQPAARFGNISVMPTPILQPNNVKRSAYLVDMHSRTGYSGSPVFVYRTPGNNLDHSHRRLMHKAEDVLEHYFRDAFFELLGIHCGQFPEELKITEKKAESCESKSLVVEGAVVTGFSGMTFVIPSDAIVDLLELPEVKMKRSDGNAALKPPKSAAVSSNPMP
jgi:hypothetical protein